MLINEYSLLENSHGRGYRDDPYVMDDLYVRGDSSVTWQVSGTGRFGINLSDMTTQLFEQGIYNTLISIFVNDTLVKVANSPDETVSDFGLLIDLDDDISNIRLSFNGSENSLLYINKISSFLYQDSPEPTTSAETTVAPESGDREEDPIRDNGIRLLSFDLDASCGPHGLRVLPDTGEFHLLNNEVWFTGNKVTEREYNVRVEAFNNNGVISSRDISFSVLDCNSSESCSSGGGDGGGGEVDDDMNTISNISPSLGQCGTNDDGTFVSVSISWTGEQDKSSDIQISQGNSFGIVYLEYVSIAQNNFQVLLPVNETFFIRGRQREGSSISRWSEVVQFNTQFIGDCTGTIVDPDPPETLPVPCIDPTPPEDPATPDPTDPRPDPPDPRYPRDPSPGGPDPCRGAGCGGGGGGGGGQPTNPDPGLPCCYTPPGCIGPGCSPGSGPNGPGGPNNPGNPGGPGGPDDPNPPEEFPPETPTPTRPTCEDGSVHTTRIQVLNQAPAGSNEFVQVFIKWDKEANPSCGNYIDSIDVEDFSLVVDSFSVSPQQLVDIDLGNACPECLNICMTSAEEVQASYKVISIGYDDRGNPTTPYVAIQSTESTQQTCGCLGLSIGDVWPQSDKSENGVRDWIRATPLNSIQGKKDFALLRPLEPQEGCWQFKQTTIRDNPSLNQERSKVACYSCTERGFKEVTSEIIGCEVAFNRVFDDSNPPGNVQRKVSYPNHWEMGFSSYQFAEQDWPNTSFDTWGSDISPFRSSWDLEVPICVTCCEKTAPGRYQVTPGNNGVSTNTRLGSWPWNSFNNIDCSTGIGDVDQNMEGHTPPQGFQGNTASYQLVGPCVGPNLHNWQYGDVYGAANNLYHFEDWKGFTPITRAEADVITQGLFDNGNGVSCYRYDGVPIECTQPMNKNYAYIRESSFNYLYCRPAPVDADPDRIINYQIRSTSGPAGPPNNGVYINARPSTSPTGTCSVFTAAGDAKFPQSCVVADFGAFEAPLGSDCWGDGPGGELADGTPYNARARFSLVYAGVPVATGPAGNNPLP